MLRTLFVGILFGFTFSVQAQLDYAGTAYSKKLPFSYDEKCAKKCGNAPRLVDLPAIDEVNFTSEVAKATNWNKCIDKCGGLKIHLGKRVEEHSVQQPRTYTELQNELRVCQGQLQVVQEQEPKIFGKLFREFKKIEPNLEDDSMSLSEKRARKAVSK
jgi:hypothetical protein